jgi:hypothetical protein
MRRTSLALGSLLALTILGHAAHGDVSPERDRARTYLMLRVVDALNLSDEKALEMRTILRRADDRRLVLTHKRDSLETQLRTALAQSPVDEPGLSRLVGDAHAVQRELAALPEHTFSEAQKILTIPQQAKLLLFRRDLQGEVRQAIRRRAASTPAPTPPHPHAR